MRVAIVQEHVNIERGGAETSTLELARRLANLDLEVTVVCSASARALLPDSGTTPVLIESLPGRGGSRTQRTVNFLSDADRYCRMQGFDIVHAITPCLSANVYQPRGGTYVETVNRSVAVMRTPVGRLIKRLARRFNRRQRFLLLLERQMLRDRKPPFVAAVSDYVRRQVRDAFPTFPPDHIRVVFNGVDVEPLAADVAAQQRSTVRKQLGAEHGRPLVLFAAHNFKLKGLAELIRAAATPTGRKADWLLAVAGRDDPRRYAALARRQRVEHRVKFVGAFQPVAALYAAAGVLAHPTWYDPCSRVVLEALSSGLPVVTTQYNGAAEVIEAGRHGEVISSPRDVTGLAEAIVRCFDTHLACACRESASVMRERLSMARHARELKALYAEVVRH